MIENYFRKGQRSTMSGPILFPQVGINNKQFQEYLFRSYCEIVVRFFC
jgi:hypothetical protein